MGVISVKPSIAILKANGKKGMGAGLCPGGHEPMEMYLKKIKSLLGKLILRPCLQGLCLPAQGCTNVPCTATAPNVTAV